MFFENLIIETENLNTSEKWLKNVDNTFISNEWYSHLLALLISEIVKLTLTDILFWIQTTKFYSDF